MTEQDRVITKADRIYTKLEDKRMVGEAIHATLVVIEITKAGKNVELYRQELVIGE